MYEGGSGLSVQANFSRETVIQKSDYSHRFHISGMFFSADSFSSTLQVESGKGE